MNETPTTIDQTPNETDRTKQMKTNTRNNLSRLATALAECRLGHAWKCATCGYAYDQPLADPTTRPPEQHSPLPWQVIVNGLFDAIGEPVNQHDKLNRAYIVKAANEYPKLRSIIEKGNSQVWAEACLKAEAQRDELLAALREVFSEYKKGKCEILAGVCLKAREAIANATK